MFSRPSSEGKIKLRSFEDKSSDAVQMLEGSMPRRGIDK
jgi:hypothetical protein